MRRLIPGYIASKAADRREKGWLNCYTVFVDLEGFSAPTRTMMEHGWEGVEVLCDIINAIFTPAIQTIESCGGFIAGFAGDAFTALFPIDPERNALIAGGLDAIRGQMERYGTWDTRFGNFKLGIHIGASRGRVNWRIVYRQPHNIFWFRGQGIQRAVECETRAEYNQIVFDEHFLGCLPKGILHFSQGDGFYHLEPMKELFTRMRASISQISMDGFIPKAIREMTNTGEFRVIIAGFINLKKPHEKDIFKIQDLCSLYGGYFNKVDVTDKGFVILVLFGAPTAQERNVSRAVDFALEVRDSCGSNARIGMTWGRAFTGFIGSRQRSEYTAIGMSVNLAARFMMKAEWNEILVDTQIMEELQENYIFTGTGAYDFKGFSDPVDVYRLDRQHIHVPTAEEQDLIVGRESEIHFLQSTFDPLWSNSFAGVSYIYGEMGQGKSRLVEEISAIYQDRVNTIWCRCNSVIQSPLNPFINWLKILFTSTEKESIPSRRADFRHHWKRFMDRFDPDHPEHAGILEELQRIESIIAGLLGLDWEGSLWRRLGDRDRATVVRIALKSLLSAFATLQPVLLILEDIHWLDQASAEAITIITRKPEHTPVKVIATSRFCENGEKPELKLDEELKPDQIELKPLSVLQITKLINILLGKPVSPGLATDIYRRSKGNPLFARELLFYYKSSDLLFLQNGRYSLDESPRDHPPLLQDLMAARIDRLRPELREIVRTAGVLGHEFSADVLSRMLYSMHAGIYLYTAIGVLLQEGEERNIWYSLSPNRYSFTHSLLHESALQMMLKKQLRRLHLLAGYTMEDLYRDNKAYLFEIAIHFDMGGQWKKAMDYLTRSGQTNLSDFRFQEALDHLERALRILEEHEGEENPASADLLMRLGMVYHRMGEYARALDYLRRALNIRLKINGDSDLATADVYGRIGLNYCLSGDFNRAKHYLNKELEIDQTVLGMKHQTTAQAHHSLGMVYQRQGEYISAQQSFTLALDISLSVYGIKHLDSAMIFNSIGGSYFYCGQWNNALQNFQKALKIRLDLLGEEDPLIAASYNNIGAVYKEQGDYEKALDYHHRSLDILLKTLGERHPDTATSYNNIGAVFASRGDSSRAVEYYERALDIRLVILGDQHPLIAGSYTNIGVIYGNQGEMEKALELFRKSLDLRLKILGLRHPDTAVSMTNIANIHALLGEQDKALMYYRRALEIRLKVFGKSHPSTLETMISLAETYERQGDHDTAREILKEQIEAAMSHEPVIPEFPDDNTPS